MKGTEEHTEAARKNIFSQSEYRVLISQAHTGSEMADPVQDSSCSRTMAMPLVSDGRCSEGKGKLIDML